jgi:hypothetical protein
MLYVIDAPQQAGLSSLVHTGRHDRFYAMVEDMTALIITHRFTTAARRSTAPPARSSCWRPGAEGRALKAGR